MHIENNKENKFNASDVVISEKNSKVQGRATVKLFDSYSGKLQYETETHNTIYDYVYQYLEDYQWYVFCLGFGFENYNINMRGNFTMNDISLSSSENFGLSDVNIFNYVGLPAGQMNKIIAWADKSSYSGTDNRRGSLNTELSYGDPYRAHWVFDWGPNAGNGTFSHIYWGGLTTPQLYYESLIITYRSRNIASRTPIACVGDYFYSLLYDGTIEVISKQDYTVVRTTQADISTSEYTGFGLTTDGQYLYAIDYLGNVYCLTLEGRIVWGPKFVGAIIDPDTKIVFGFGCDGTYLYAFYYGAIIKLTMDGTVVLPWINVDIPVYRNVGVDIESDGTYLYAIRAGAHFYKLTKDGQIIFHQQMDQFGSWFEKIGLAYDGRYLYAMNSFGQMLKNINIKLILLAHTVLPTPITKTSSQTMRIEYDFIRG